MHPIFNPVNDSLLHIQMELCYKSMAQIIEQMSLEFSQKPLEGMTQSIIISLVNY
jgi:hypothetical protein